MKKYQLSPIALALCFSLNANGQVINLDDFYYRDYLDFGQNKGAFSPRTTPLDYEGKHGVVAHFVGVPDFNNANNAGNITAIGRNVAVTATHVGVVFDQKEMAQLANSPYNIWGNTAYKFHHEKTLSIPAEQRQHTFSKNEERDTAFVRTNKYIVEGNGNLLDVPNFADPTQQVVAAEEKCKAISGHSEKVACYDQAFLLKKQLKQTLTDYLQTNIKKDANGNPQVYQAGTGFLTFLKDKKPYGSNNTDVRTKEIANAYNGRAGGIWVLDDHNRSGFHSEDGGYSVEWASPSSSRQMRIGSGFVIRATARSDVVKNPFYDATSNGDSGSPLWGFDTRTNQWVVLGVVSTGGGDTSAWSPSLLSDLRNYLKDYEHNATSVSDIKVGKDNIFTAPADLTLTQDLHLKSGGLVFKQGENYLKGNVNASDIAGVDIAEGATLHWQAPTLNNGSLHKVGQGTLTVSNATNGTLRFGQGTVELQNANAFNKIYVTGRNAVLKLAQGFNPSEKVFFGYGGGQLDVNGNDLTLTQLSVDNNNAQLVNSGANAKVTLAFAPAEQNATLVHAKLNGAEKLDVNVASAGQKVVFDGGFNINHLEIDSDTQLQAHPTIHASIKPSEVNPNQTLPKPADSCTYQHALDGYYEHPGRQCTLDVSQKIEDRPAWMDLTRPSTLGQPDWDERHYIAQKVTVNAGKNLTVASSAELNADVKLNAGSSLTFGDKTHYIDRFDGENTYGDGFSYHQQISSGSVVKDFGEKRFDHAITADNATITSTIAHFNPSLTMTGGKLTATHWTVDNGHRSVLTNATASVDHLHLKQGTVNAQDTSLTVQKSFVMSGGTLNAGTTAAHPLQFKNVDKVTHTGGTLNAKFIQLENSHIANHLNVQGLQGADLRRNSSVNFDKIDLAKTILLTDDNSKVQVQTLTVPNQTVLLDANVVINKTLDITQGKATNVKSSREVTLAKAATINVTLSDEFKNQLVTADKNVTVNIPFEKLNLNSDTLVNFNVSAQESDYYSFKATPTGLQLIKSTEDPMSDQALDQLSKDKLVDELKTVSNPVIERQFKAAAMGHNAKAMQKLVQNVTQDLQKVAQLRDPNSVLFETEQDPFLNGQRNLATKTIANKNGVSQWLGGHILAENGFALGAGVQAGHSAGADFTVQYTQGNRRFAWQTLYRKGSENVDFYALSTKRQQQAKWQHSSLASKIAGEYAVDFANHWQGRVQGSVGYQQLNSKTLETQDFYAEKATNRYLTLGTKLTLAYAMERLAGSLYAGVTHYANLGDSQQKVGFKGNQALDYAGEKARLQWQLGAALNYQFSQAFELGIGVDQSNATTNGNLTLKWLF